MRKFLVVNNLLILVLLFSCSNRKKEFTFDTLIVINYSEVPYGKKDVREYVITINNTIKKINVEKYYPLQIQNSKLNISDGTIKINDFIKINNVENPNAFFYLKGSRINEAYIDMDSLNYFLEKYTVCEEFKRNSPLQIHDENFDDAEIIYLNHFANSMVNKRISKNKKKWKIVKEMNATIFKDSMVATKVILVSNRKGKYRIQMDSLSSNEFMWDF